MSRPWHFTFLGYQVGFERPLALALCAFAVVIAMVGVTVGLSRRRRVARVVSARLVDSLAPGIPFLRPLVSAACYAAGLFLLAWAAAQPQCGAHAELVKRRGIDVVVALDVSKSMRARDVQPSRLERAKLELSTLLDSLKGDRVGIVVFAGDAFIQCPLTSDYAAAKMFLKAVDPEQMAEPGTSIAAAMERAKQVFDGAERGSKEKVVVLISDGEDLSGDVQESLDALKEEGIRVFSVGIGSETGEPIPLFDKQGEIAGYKKDAAGNPILTRLDRAGLTRIAEETGGEFFYQPKAVAIGGVVDAIAKLQKSELDSRLSVRYVERFQYFLGPGLGLVLAAMLVVPGRRRR